MKMVKKHICMYYLLSLQVPQSSSRSDGLTWRNAVGPRPQKRSGTNNGLQTDYMSGLYILILPNPISSRSLNPLVN